MFVRGGKAPRRREATAEEAVGFGQQQQQMDHLDTVTCSICLEIFEKPMKISCSHVFCRDCISASLNLAEPQCPLCRSSFNPNQVHKAPDIQALIASGESACRWCSKRMALSRLRNHSLQCAKLEKRIPHFKPIAHTSHPPPSKPNRSTFQCPYCGLQNLDYGGLVSHCTSQHVSSSAKVVCPICASMPWGEQSRVSSNFIQHLNLRHQFEYDTFVDFEKGDEEMLQTVLKNSVEDV